MAKRPNNRVKRATEKNVEDVLVQVFDLLSSRMCGRWREVQTFEQAGVLTGDKGVVVRGADFSEFQITIVRSR
jgi:hypothetical protein